LMALKRFSMVAEISLAARMPLPGAIIAIAVASACNSLKYNPILMQALDSKSELMQMKWIAANVCRAAA